MCDGLSSQRRSGGLRTRPGERRPAGGGCGGLQRASPARDKGIGGAIIYLIDRFEDALSIYDVDFKYLDGVDRRPEGCGFNRSSIISLTTCTRGAWTIGRLL